MSVAVRRGRDTGCPLETQEGKLGTLKSTTEIDQKNIRLKIVQKAVCTASELEIEKTERSQGAQSARRYQLIQQPGDLPVLDSLKSILLNLRRRKRQETSLKFHATTFSPLHAPRQ